MNRSPVENPGKLDESRPKSDFKLDKRDYISIPAAAIVAVLWSASAASDAMMTMGEAEAEEEVRRSAAVDVAADPPVAPRFR